MSQIKKNISHKALLKECLKPGRVFFRDLTLRCNICEDFHYQELFRNTKLYSTIYNIV